MQVRVAVSARHIHLCQIDAERLFGPDYDFRMLRELSQKGQYAAHETVRILTNHWEFPTVRVVGPVRRKTQLELSRTDALKLGILPPVRISGDLYDTPGIRIVGPAGEIDLHEGVIIAARHIHLDPSTAQTLGVIERQSLTVRLVGERPITLERVYARISPLFQTELHIDTDDANAAGVVSGDFAEILSVHPFS